MRSEMLRISSDEFPERSRIAMWRENYGRMLCRFNMEPLPHSEFRADCRVHRLPGLSVISGTGGGLRQELISDGNSDFCLVVNFNGQLMLSQRGAQFALGEQEATLLSFGETGEFSRPTLGHFRCLRMPRSMIDPLLPNADDQVMRRIPRNSVMLQLLAGYLGLLEESCVLADPQTVPLIVSQIYNLVAATICYTSDAMAKRPGIREARLATIRADILANLSQVRLSPRMIASRQGLSVRYVHLLFEETGTTFNRFVEEERLKRAFAMLTNPAWVKVPIGDIAIRLGFPEHSTFHRAFRRHFNATPGDVRRQNFKCLPTRVDHLDQSTMNKHDLR